MRIGIKLKRPTSKFIITKQEVIKIKIFFEHIQSA